jgi:hypothetical protein
MRDKVFVSPGVYTSERDLSFVTTNIGVTTLGLVGEVTKGPAFKPVFISNYNEFKTFFGGLNPEKNKDTGILKYELPYIAKSYLKNSNQLYVTRVLGLSGYDAQAAYVVSVGGQDVAILRPRGKYVDEVFESKVAAAPTIAGPDPVNGVITMNIDGKDYNFSLDKTKADYITRIFGVEADKGNAPVFVEEVYQSYIDELVEADGTANVTVNEVAGLDHYKFGYTNAATPYIVSEVKGGTVDRLFRFHTISDGNNSNTDVKVSIVNIRPDDREFDVIVRKFDDTDAAPVQLERFSKCNLDPTSGNYVGRKIGTLNGDYASISSYIMIEMAEGYDVDSFPAGFEGYTVRDGVTIPNVSYKKEYGTYEKKRRAYLGITKSFDADILKFKGKKDADGAEFVNKTKGFHLDSGAPAAEFEVGAVAFASESGVAGTVYEKDYARKFTVAFAGGFDGWDIYRTNRTNTENYTRQKIETRAIEGIPNLFSALPLTDGDVGYNSDYYAYLEGVRTFSNPEDVNVNIFATPGIDTLNNPNLIEYAIEMIERERGDCLYIVTTPDLNTDGSIKTAQEVADDMDGEFDTSYTATYWPWIQINDTENNSLVYVPPTCDVVKNIALTDNIAHPWFATAGFDRGDVDAIKTRVKLTQADREILYASRINPIASFTGDGIKIFGNKTLQIKDSALNRVSVRRLLLQTRKLISAVAVRLLFDQNDATVRREFLKGVNPILENIRKERGLADFRVKLTDANEENDRNTLSGKIFIKPTPALEFIELDFNIMPSGASFEDL